MEFFATSDDILRLSLLTLVLRAVPKPAGAPTTFSPSCIEAARATLHRHQDCLAIIERSTEDFLPTYVHWYVTPRPGHCPLKIRKHGAEFSLTEIQDPPLRAVYTLHRGLLPRD